MQAPPSQYPSCRYRVLAITHEAALVEQIEARLPPDAGGDIVLAGDELELVARFAHGHVPLVIIDVDLLEDQSLVLIDVVRELDAACHVLLLLSPEHMELCRAALSLGLVSFLTKPFDPTGAARIIRATLEHHRSQPG